MSVYDWIEDGKYTNRLPYPDKPDRPAILIKKAGELTKSELAEVGRIKDRHEAAKAEYSAAHDRWLIGEQEAEALFWPDVYEENGIPLDCPFGAKMQQLAWHRGHSFGLSDVLAEFDSLMPLYELYAKAKTGCESGTR